MKLAFQPPKKVAHTEVSAHCEFECGTPIRAHWKYNTLSLCEIQKALHRAPMPQDLITGHDITSSRDWLTFRSTQTSHCQHNEQSQHHY